MIGLRRALWGLGALGVIWGLALIPLAVTSDHLDLRGLILVAVLGAGWGYIGTGLFVWGRRPESAFGALMAATGFTWFVAMLSLSDASLVFSIGMAFSAVYFATLMHLLLAFPDGQLQSRRERLTIGIAYLLTTLALPVLLLFTDFRTDYDCPECPSNAFLVEHSETVVDVGTGLLSGIGALLAIAVMFFLWGRKRKATPAQWRKLRVVVVPGLVVLGLLAILAGGGAAGADDPATVANVAGTAAFALMPYVFMAGVFRARLAGGGAVRELVGRLSEAPAPGDLQSALRRALSDPSLEVVYWLPDTRRYVDGDGAPVVPPAPGSGRALTAVERDGVRVGAMVHDAAVGVQEPELLQAVGAAAALALENDRLEAELRCRIEDLRSSRARLLEVGFTERRRLERNLHDGAQQRLVSLALGLRMARARLRDDPATAEEMLDAAGAELDAALEELRELARGIHPAVLSDRGLDAALESIAARAPLRVELDRALGERLPGPIELAAYYVVAEALTNVVKYAGASHASVRATRDNGYLMVEISDDGVGGADVERGTGLRGLADRLAALEGRLEVESVEGGGTTVRAVIPCG